MVQKEKEQKIEILILQRTNKKGSNWTKSIVKKDEVGDKRSSYIWCFILKFKVNYIKILKK